MPVNRKTNRWTMYGLLAALAIFILFYGLLPLFGTAAAS